MPPFAAQFFGGAGELQVAAESLFGLVAALEQIAPGFAEEAELRAAFAVDGAVQADWSVRLADGAEVILFARVAGG
jgi:molybdopterin converting factor small subunit